MRSRPVACRFAAAATAVLVAAVMAGLALAAPAAQPRSGGVLNTTYAADSVMNSVLALGIPSFWTSAILFDALTKPDAAGRPVPNLAERWEISSHGKTYTFWPLSGGVCA